MNLLKHTSPMFLPFNLSAMFLESRAPALLRFGHTCLVVSCFRLVLLFPNFQCVGAGLVGVSFVSRWDEVFFF